VRDGREIAPPGYGPLAAGIAFTRSGAVRWLDAAGTDRARATLTAGSGRVVSGAAPAVAETSAAGRQAEDPIVAAFQSYPRLLAGGAVVPAIRSGQGVDARHRDARLAIGQTRDGRLVLALTRFGQRESAVSRIPIGLTLAETAGLMGSLGCTDAMMLDGGLSAQLMVRSHSGAPMLWRGARRVPVALVFTDR
jgi:exopolysaccharide biosynthesis protein